MSTKTTFYNVVLGSFLTLSAQNAYPAGALEKVENLIFKIDRFLGPEPEQGVSHYHIERKIYTFEDQDEEFYTNLDEPKVNSEDDSDDDSAEISENDSDDDSSDMSDNDMIEPQPYAEYFVGSTAKYKFENSFKNNQFSTILHDISRFNTRLDRDNLVYIEFNPNETSNLSKALLNLKKSFGKKDLNSETKHLLTEPMKLLEMYLTDEIARIYGEDVGVKCYSAIVRHYKNSYSNSVPHLDGMSSMVKGNVPDSNQLIKSLINLNEIADPYSLADNISDFISKTVKNGKFFKSVNIWAPLQDSAVGIPLAFLHDKRNLDDYSLHEGRVYYTPIRKVIIDDEEVSSSSLFVNEPVDAHTWVYKKDIQFGGLYIWDTFKKIHSSFNLPNDKRGRDSIDLRFLIYKK